jgi:excisionase family DNA binding protein
VPKPSRDTLTPKQAAELCGVDRTTMRRWLIEDAIPHTVTPGGWRRIAPADLAGFMRAHGIPVPPWLEPGPGRVLLVDDEPAVTRSVRRMLLHRAPGLQVKAVHEGFGAGVMALSFEPNVIVLDIVMPGMDGIEVCRWVMTEPRLSGVAVVILSGHLDQAVERQLLELGAKVCLRKPVGSDDLWEVVRRYLPAGQEARARSEIGA